MTQWSDAALMCINVQMPQLPDESYSSKTDEEAQRDVSRYSCALQASLYKLSNPDVSLIPRGATFVMETILQAPFKMVPRYLR